MSVYVDEEALLVAWLPSRIAPAPRVGVATPADPDATFAWVATGFVVVHRIGGTGRVGVDTPRISVQCFHLDYGQAKQLAGQVRDAIESMPGATNSPNTVLATRTTSGPTWTPYDDPHVQRFAATYEITTHLA